MTVTWTRLIDALTLAAAVAMGTLMLVREPFTLFTGTVTLLLILPWIGFRQVARRVSGWKMRGWSLVLLLFTATAGLVDLWRASNDLLAPVTFLMVAGVEMVLLLLLAATDFIHRWWVRRSRGPASV